MNPQAKSDMDLTVIAHILEASDADPGLSDLLGDAREYAQIYVLARQRQKGCDGMGELATIKEEFRDALDKVMHYCLEKKYLAEDISYDIDLIADELGKAQHPL